MHPKLKKYLFLASFIATIFALSQQSAEAATGFLSRPLQLGDTDQEVLLLQKILNDTGNVITKTGPGSPGNETNLFGPLTETAVKAFQCVYKVACSNSGDTSNWGIVGPKTRALLNDLSAEASKKVSADISKTASNKDEGFFSKIFSSVKKMISSVSGRSQVAAVSSFDSSLVTYYPLEDGVGSLTADYSSNGHIGTLMGNPTWSTGSDKRIGSGALSFDGADDYMVAPVGVYTNSAPGYSISMWVKAPSSVGTARGLYTEMRADKNCNLCFDNVNGTNDKLGIYISNGTPVSNMSSEVVFNNNWHHIVWTDHQGIANLYIDGTSSVPYGNPTWNYTQGSVASTDKTRIGAVEQYTVGSFFLGSIDDVRQYNVALNQSQVADLYQYTSGGYTTPTNGVCGVAAKTYQPTDTLSTVSTDFCSAGSPSSIPSSISQGGSATWVCNSPNGGTEPVCSANRLDGTAPTTPLNLRTAAVPSGVNLNWNVSTDGTGVYGYKIYRNGVQVGTSTNRRYAFIDYTETPAPHLYSDESVSPSTVYLYNVSAYDIDGNESARSATSTVTTLPSGTLLFGGSPLAAGLIPQDRTIDWSQAGVPGGIPARTGTPCATLNPGATVAEINDAIASCPADGVVYLNEGTYNLASQIIFPYQGWPAKGITLRGAGAGKTIINSGSTNTGIGPENGYATGDNNGDSNGTDIASGYTKGSTQVILAEAANAEIGVGKIINFHEDEDVSFMFHTLKEEYPDYHHMQLLSRVTGVSDLVPNSGDRKVISFSPSLPYGLTASLRPKLSHQRGGNNRGWYGVEDMTINLPNGNRAVVYNGNYASWVKGVEVTGFQDTGIMFFECLQCEVRDSYIHNPKGTNNPPIYTNSDGYGVGLYSATTYSKVENNTMSKIAQGIIQSGSSANVGLYNYINYNIAGSGPDNSGNWIIPRQYPAINVNHGGQDMMELWEGNVGEQWQNDSYHGSASHQTLFRNSFNGLHPAVTVGRKMLDIGRGSYYHNVIGNVLGDLSWAGQNTVFEYSWVGTGPPTTYDFGIMYRLGAPNLDNNCWCESRLDNGWQDSYNMTYPDPKVESTLFRWGNWDSYTDSTDGSGTGIRYNDALPSGVSTPSVSIPDSLYYSSTPSWWPSTSVVPWPPIGPDVSGGTSGSAGHSHKIPAEVCFEQGKMPGYQGCGEIINASASVSDTTDPVVSITSPSSTTISGTVSLAATASDNVGVEGVTFKLDGAVIGSGELTVSPYSGTWNTTGVPNGSHSLTATARDAAGNTKTATITVTVSNTTTTTTTTTTTGGGTTSSGGGTTSGSGSGSVGGASTGTFIATVNQPVRSTVCTPTYTTSNLPSLPAYTSSLKVGSKGTQVKSLQQFLVTNGQFLNQRQVDGSYGPITGAAITAYNKARANKVQTNTCPTTQATTTGTQTSNAKYVFTRSLKQGDSGADVKALQVFLNNNGFTITTKGAGSKGNEGTFFGAQTKAALIRFQIAKNIKPAIGNFGPLTRGVVGK